MTIKLLFPAAALLFLASPLLAADAAKPGDRQSLIEMHQKMAKAHQKAAVCLKAGKPVDECNREAMKMCPMANSEKCPFMGNMGGMMKDQMKGDHSGGQQQENNER